MADKAPDAAPEVKPAEKLFKVTLFQFNRADGSGNFRQDQIIADSEFPADELAYLIEIGALVPTE